MSYDGESMTAQWTDPTGVVWDLTNTAPDSNLFTQKGITGWGARPYTYVTDPLARGGVNVRFIRSEPGRLVWPLHVWGDDHLDWLTNYRAIKRAIMMTVHRGQPGVLRVTRPDGTAREIDAFYEDGFGGQGGEDDWVSSNPVVTFMCPDGYWRDTVAATVPRSYSAGQSFLSPFPSISSGQVLGASVVTNMGEITAWPDWTITGPATVITATNNTTGQGFVLTKTLTAGQLVTISTSDGTVRGPVGENLVNALNWPSAYLWPLLPGDNSVTFSVAGATAGTAIQLSYYPRYEGA